MMKKIRYTRSRLREKMLLGVAMVVWCSLWKVWYAHMSYALQGGHGTVVSARKVVIVVLGLNIH